VFTPIDFHLSRNTFVQNIIIMKKQLLKLGSLKIAAMIALGWTQSANAQFYIDSLVYTGGMQTYTVPAGVTSIKIEAFGAQGANGFNGGQGALGGIGAAGAYASGFLSVTPGQVLNIFVGGQASGSGGGFNGGGTGGNASGNGGGGGGGATDIRVGGTLPSNRILVAGGGGGAGAAGCLGLIPAGGNGGLGGGGNGIDGVTTPTAGGNAGGGFGAVGATGGLKGIGCALFSGTDGITATTGIGGNGGGVQSCCCTGSPGGGAGGGGFIGGGGGGGGSAGTAGCSGNDKGGGGGGAGGSSYTGGMTTAGALAQGIRSGNGVVKISYSFQQELLYYKFDGSGTAVLNYAVGATPATDTAFIQGGITQGAGGKCNGALIGSGVSSSTDFLNTNYAPNLGIGPWTISFWTKDITPSGTLFYIFGDANSTSFRCFTNGVAGANNWILRGAGLTDVLINGGATVAPHLMTYVYDTIGGRNVKAYLDGVLVNTVAQTAPNLTGTGPLKVMGYSASVGAPAGGKLDEFRLMSKALTTTEVANLYTVTSSISPVSCGNYTSPAGKTYTTTGVYTDTLQIANCKDSIITINLTVNAIPTITTNGDTTCAAAVGNASGTLTANPSVGSVVNWYATSTSTTSLGTGNSFPVSSNTTTTYYADASTLTTSQVGMVDNTAGGGVQQTSTNYNIFDVFKTCVIKNVLVYPGAIGNVVFDLRDNTGALLSTATVAVTSTSPVVIPLNFTVNPGTGYRLGQGTGSVSMFRNSGGVVYPYTIPGVLSIVNSAAGNTFYYFGYNWTVESANCTSVRVPAVFTVNALPTVTASATSAAVCAGGTLTLSGGGAASYTWNNGVTNGVLFIPASTNTYIVTGIDANTCTDTASITIPVNALPTITASASSSSICVGQATTLTGGGAVSYTWDNGVTNGVAFAPTATLTYTVTGTDANACSNTASSTITVNALPTVTASASFNSICEGQSTTLTGGGAVSYTWNNGVTNGIAFSPTATATYTVTGTDANTCSNTATQTVTVNANPVASLTAPVVVLCTGTPATLTGLPSGGTYSVISGSASALSGNTFNAATTGTYTVSYSTSNVAGCTDTANLNFNVNCILGLDNAIINNSSFIIMPNPNNGVFTINSTIEIDGSIELINELGQVVYKNRMNGLSQQLNVQHLAAGVYHLKVSNGNGIQTKRLSIVK
jgi:Concanavalin A-like lectin/glucanases superfamily/Secretion system C-terminal sorting domain/Ig-like domain CHU_C associated